MVPWRASLSSHCVCSGALAGVASSGPAGADQVSGLRAQAKTISEELVQEQLQAGAYQQQYSVASAQVAKDQRAIAALQTQIKTDRRQITKRLHLVQHLAIENYILNGSVSSGSGAGLFAENVSTVQSADEYATISIGNLNEAVDQLQTARRNEQSQQESLIRQRTFDQSEQKDQASYLAQATASEHRMQAVQAKVTGQLAVAVAQQNAALSRAAVVAVTTARKTTVQRSGGTGTLVSTSCNVEHEWNRGTVEHDRPHPSPVPRLRGAGGVGRQLPGGVAERPVPGGIPIQPIDMELRRGGGAPPRPGRRAAQPGQQGGPGHARRDALRTRRRAPLVGRSLQRLTVQA